MAILVCRRCTTRFAVGMHMCPHCTGESAYLLDDETEAEAIEQEEDMARSNQHGATAEGGDGVTRAVDADGNVGDPIHEVTTDDAPVDDTVVVDPPADQPVTVDNSTKVPAKKAAPTKASTK